MCGVLLACALVLLLGTTGSGVSFDSDRIYLLASSAVMLLRSRTEAGVLAATAFGIDEHGLFLTAYHAVRGSEELEFVFPKERIRYPVHLIGSDAPSDLALLKVTGPTNVRWATLRFGDSERVAIGEMCAVLGNPVGVMRVLTVARILARHASIPDRIPGSLLRFEGVVRTGNSGSPLLNRNAEVIGMVIGVSLVPGNDGGLAVSSRTIQRVLPNLLRGARAR